MNIKKLLLATVASFVVMMALGGFIHMYLLENWYKAHMAMPGIARDQPMILYIALGNALLAVIMSYMYPKGVEGGSNIMEGLKFGALIGVLWIIPFALIMYGATTVFSRSAILMDLGVHVVIQGLGGIAIAMVYGKK